MALIIPRHARGAACNATADGNWNAGGTWTGCTGAGGVPATIDTITINSGINVTLNVSATVAGLTFAANGANSDITHSGTNVLTVNGPVTFNQPTANNRINAWNVNGGSATVTGLITFAGANTTVSRISRIAITTGELNALGGITFTGSASATKVIDMSGGAGRLNLKGNLTIPANSCTLTAGTAGSIVNYADTSAAQTVRFFTAGAYHQLYVNNTSASGATLAAAVSATNVTGSLRVQSGTLKNGGFAIVGGTGDTFEVADGATFEMSGTSAFPTTYSTFTLGAASRVRYLQTTNPLTISGRDYGHLDLVSAGTATQRFPAGTWTIQGDLTVGNGTNATTADINTNGPTLTVNGNVTISANATLQADNTNPLTVGGNWTNPSGTFTHNTGTVTFNGAGTQTVNNGGDAFGKIIVQNTASGGLTFSTGFSATQLTADTSALPSGTTIYFGAGQTFTVPALAVNGTSARHVTLRSTSQGTRWNLTASGTPVVSYVEVRDSDASGGSRILDFPGGVDLTNNLNWAIGLNPPASISASASATTSLTFGWPAASPSADTHTAEFSPNIDFSAPSTSQSTALLTATTAGLLINTTYHARVATVINGVTSSWSATSSTPTLAAAPADPGDPWTEVNITSITMSWSADGNPAGTWYLAQLSTASDFSGTLLSSTTRNTQATYLSLTPATRYYGRALAVNHAAIQTAFTALGSTPTLQVNPPSNLQVTSVATNALSASWSAAATTPDSYVFEVADESLFISPLVTQNTGSLSTTTPSTLTSNTTHFARVAAIVSGSTSPWVGPVSTATLANAPAVAGTTWINVWVTSLAVAWADNGNPSGTRYDVNLSSVSNFLSGDLFTATTTALSTTIMLLDSNVVYYARVKAVNHGGTSTAWTGLGSTRTVNVPLPKNLAFTSAQATSVTASWTASTPAADTYDFVVSTGPDFVTVVTSATANTYATTAASLTPNTTYFGRVRAVISGTPYPYTAYETTSTLANAPATAGTTWTDIGITSMTVAWSANGNPAAVTRYVVQVSSRNDFSPAASSTTYNLSAQFTGLVPGVAYFARVWAVNHSGIATSIHALPASATLAPNAPSNLQFTAATTASLSASWTDSVPAADSFVLEIDDDSGFGSVNVTSATLNAFADTPATLSANTTHYARVRTIVNGSTSPWTSSISTATLAEVPATAVSTYSAVGQNTVTFSWLAGGNPAGVTLYVAELSDASDFVSGTVYSSATYNLNATFIDLLTDTDYWGRVKAVNHSGIETDWLTFSSTHTSAPNTCNSAATGNWNSGTTWTSCTGVGGVPAATDAVIINSAHTVTLNVDATVAGLTFAAPGTNNNLTHSGTNVLTVNGTVNFTQPVTNTRTSSWNINAGSATVVGPIRFNGATNSTSRISRIVITTGELNALGGIVFTGSNSTSKQIVMSAGAGRLNLQGDLTIPANSCTLTAGTAGSIFNYADNNSAQTVRFFTAGAYHQLHVNNTSASGATLGTAISATNVTGSVRVQSGTLKNGGFAIVGGAGDTFEVADGATFEMSGTSAFPSAFSTFTVGNASRIRYLQTTNPLTITGRNYGHLDLAPAGTATQRFPAGTWTIAGDLTVGNGTNAATADANTNGPSLTVGGSVVVNPNATFQADNTNGLSVGGDWTNDGTFTHNSATVTFNGSGAQTVNAGVSAFANIVDSNASSGGMTFGESFSAAQLSLATSGLGSSATIYFNAGSTATLSTLSLSGTSSFRAVIRSTVDGSPWHLANTVGHVVANANVKDSDASSGNLMTGASNCADLGNNVNWDFGPPSAVTTLSAGQGPLAGGLDLAWTATGDSPGDSPLMSGNFIIQYTTDTVFAGGYAWSPTAGLPVGVDRISIATTNVAAGAYASHSFSGLIPGATYHFRLWTQDSVGGISAISNGATTYATPVLSSVELSTDQLVFGSLTPGATVVHPVSVTVTNRSNHDATFTLSISSPTVWTPTTGPADIDTFRLSAIFQDDFPYASDFDPANDVVWGSTRTASVVNLARDGAPDVEKGVNVAPDDSRTLWFRMEMPPYSSIVDQQVIRIHVGAQP